MATCLRVALHPSVASFAPEAKYVLRTLLRLAGYAQEFVWASPNDTSDIYFGPDIEGQAFARVRIRSTGDFRDADATREPRTFFESDGLGFISFDADASGPIRGADGSVYFRNDLVRACYWLLTGAMDAHYPRDRWDNLNLSGAFVWRNGLLVRPVVSEDGAFLREFFRQGGREPLPLPWTEGGASAAFAFTHDVDYPQIIRWIECLRLLRERGLAGMDSIRSVLNGANHFWKFADWVEFEKEHGARPAFYFAAKRGSLARYAAGTPDVFYDIRTPEFADLFRTLRRAGCEVGLHASFHAHRDERSFVQEKQLLEEVTGAQVEGLRHHFWHLDPDQPNETLRLHEGAGLLYDSSLAFEYYPGFRRAICHPFHPYSPRERREIETLQVPPAWMDDHFDRRLAHNRIAAPEDSETTVREKTTLYARRLLDAARATNGIAVVDYHVRGMNADFFPRYGPQLRDFVRQYLDSSLTCLKPREIAARYLRYETALTAASADRTETQPAEVDVFEIGSMHAREAGAVARLHFALFGDAIHGASIATLGPRFLERVFYLCNLENPYYLCDVARYRGAVAGFNVYITRRDALRFLFSRHLVTFGLEAVRAALSHPGAILNMLRNVRYLGGDRSMANGIDALWLVIGVDPRFRTARFESRTGLKVAARLYDRMERTMKERGCNGWGAGMRTGNPFIKMFVESRGALRVATVRAQGVEMDQYVKMLTTAHEAKP